MSNGVEVLVKEKNYERDNDERHIKQLKSPMKSTRHYSHSPTHKSLLSSTVMTIYNQRSSFPMNYQQNYIIKTCLTTFTYLTTLVHNKRSAVSTFETTVSVISTESLANIFNSDVVLEIKPSKTKSYMEQKTAQPTPITNNFKSNLPKLDKRIDSAEEGNMNFDLIQPSESGHVHCSSPCTCIHKETESLKTKYDYDYIKKLPLKTTKYDSAIRPSLKQNYEKNTQNEPYNYEENWNEAPTDKVVEKYTEVISESNDGKYENSELLTDEQAPSKKTNTKIEQLNKPAKITANTKNKFVVADLLKLGRLGIKSLSQLAPVIEKMTGGFMKRHESNKTSLTSTTEKSELTELTAYNSNKRIDSELENKQGNFPIYIPVDEMETSESQNVYSNFTLHQNMAWPDFKLAKAHLYQPKIVHESALVNGGIPISPGDIITTNSDVIVGKPAVGGPLTLGSSSIKLHNQVPKPPPIDSISANSNQNIMQAKPESEQYFQSKQADDSFDLRPPDLLRKPRIPPRSIIRPHYQNHIHHQNHDLKFNRPPTPSHNSEHVMKTEHVQSPVNILGNHGRPAFLDYIPSLARPSTTHKPDYHNYKVNEDNQDDLETPDNSPSASELINTRVTTKGQAVTSNAYTPDPLSKPLLVDIQPSRVANVLIPHGSTTALVFAGSSEPHKTGDYVDESLPYSQPGYFGSFSIDAPQMTNVHASPVVSKPGDSEKLNNQEIQLNEGESIRNEVKQKWSESNRPYEFSNLPPPTSNQETHVQVGPHITVYNPDVFKPNGNGQFEKYSKLKNKEKYPKPIIDKEYENYLAVPPPPPKMHFRPENNFDKSSFPRPPVVQTKPVQDMKVYMSIQHPIPIPVTPEKFPPRVTSEIYFASQAPQNVPTTTFTMNMTPKQNQNQVKYYNDQKPNVQNIPVPSMKPLRFPAPSPVSRPQDTLNIQNSPDLNKEDKKQSTYTVTLNTATNVDGGISESGHVIGSSIPVAINDNANIPVGANFVFQVEDSLSSLNGQSEKPPSIITEDNVPTQVYDKNGNNQWNVSSLTAFTRYPYRQTDFEQYSISTKEPAIPTENYVKTNLDYHVNSHANFPMLNVHSSTPNTIEENSKPIRTGIRKQNENQNKQTNSHSWYSSMSDENVKNIKIDISTRQTIPLIQDYSSEKLPNFGEKVQSAGKPPSDLWTKKQSIMENGKPFTPQNVKDIQTSTAKNYNANYIRHQNNLPKQPVYDIPLKQTSDETTTAKVTTNAHVIYEDNEEIYDGKENEESENDGEVSQESMKVPFVSSSEATSTEKENMRSTSEISLLKEESYEPTKKPTKSKSSYKKHSYISTQTEKPFNPEAYKNSHFHTNAMKPINDDNVPRPFVVNPTTPFDVQLQQPHWQINQLVENATNVSAEEFVELNLGEEMSTKSQKSEIVSKVPFVQRLKDDKYKRTRRPVFSLRNNTITNNTGIITSTMQIRDKKPLTVINREPTNFASTSKETSTSSEEILDLEPPPPTNDYKFKPTGKDEIMGMNPPPKDTPNRQIITHSRPAVTVRPMLPKRASVQPYRPKPMRTTTQKSAKKPIISDEISTYRPPYDIIKEKLPSYNYRDQPSSVLQPPVRVSTKLTQVDKVVLNSSPSVKPNIVFPTPVSSGWLTSSGFDFSSSFDFEPSINSHPQPSLVSDSPATSTSSDEIYSAEESSSENSHYFDIKRTTESLDRYSPGFHGNSHSPPIAINNDNEEGAASNEYVLNNPTTTEKNKLSSIKNKYKTRKPFPVKDDDSNTSSSTSVRKYKLPSRTYSTIKPTRTLLRTDLYSSRHTSTRKVTRPLVSKPGNNIKPSIIESSETFVDDEFESTDSQQKSTPTITLNTVYEDSKNAPILLEQTKLAENEIINVKPTHHAGNEIKISDDVLPTKTEFKTTVVTLTKTLSEPPRTVSSINYLNVTHTVTETQTKTSLLSQSEGAITETLVLTNTQTSTRVDVVTEVQTKVQPTTIVETITKHIPISQVEPTPVKNVPTQTKLPIDNIAMSSEENENFIIRDSETTEHIQKIDQGPESDNNTFFVVINKSQGGGPAVASDIETNDFDVTRNEQVNSNGVSQVLFGEILLAGTPYLETTNVGGPQGTGYGKDCQPDCKASRNERCQRIDGLMKCVCRPGFARMFPDRPCKPTYTYSVNLVLSSQGREKLRFHQYLADNSSKQYQALAMATYEGLNRMIMQSDLRDVYHGVKITGFQPIDMLSDNEVYKGVMNDFYVQLSDNAHESRLKEVIEKYLRNNNYSLGGTNVYAASELVDRLNVSDFDECTSGLFHDCSEHAKCFNLRGTYTCSCKEGFADLSVNPLYPGRICSAEQVGCERCNYHGACYSRDDRRVLCECFQWYAGSTCHINLKVVLISMVTGGALLTIILIVCAVVACSKKPRPPQRSIVACIQNMPGLHQTNLPSGKRADRRALISERADSGDASSGQNISLPYVPIKKVSSTILKKMTIADPPSHEPPPPPAPAVMIPRARLHATHRDSRDHSANNIVTRKQSVEVCSEAKLISYLESGATNNNEEMKRRKHSEDSCYSIQKDRHNKQGALVSAGFKVSTTIRQDDPRDDRDDMSSINKNDYHRELSRYESMRHNYSQDDMSEWTDAERRIGELTLSEARSVGGTLPASTGRAASSTRLTLQEANTMAERDLGSTFLLPHVHLYKPDITSDVSEFDSL